MPSPRDVTIFFTFGGGNSGFTTALITFRVGSFPCVGFVVADHGQWVCIQESKSEEWGVSSV